jgi:hypothetical protein
MKKILLLIAALTYVFSASLALAKTEKSNNKDTNAVVSKSNTVAKSDKPAKAPTRVDNDSEEEYNLLEGEVEGSGE